MKIEELLHDEYLDEGAKRAYKRMGMEIVRKYRCTSGRKKGKLVSDPAQCSMRKNPKKVRQGRKSARLNKAVRVRKTQMAKRSSLSKVLRSMNKRLG